MKNHGKIDINRLSAETKEYMFCLMNAIREEPGIEKAQVTFDFKPDEPPTMHVITTPCDHGESDIHVNDDNTVCAPVYYGVAG